MFPTKVNFPCMQIKGAVLATANPSEPTTARAKAAMDKHSVNAVPRSILAPPGPVQSYRLGKKLGQHYVQLVPQAPEAPLQSPLGMNAQQVRTATEEHPDQHMLETSRGATATAAADAATASLSTLTDPNMRGRLSGAAADGSEVSSALRTAPSTRELAAATASVVPAAGFRPTQLVGGRHVSSVAGIAVAGLRGSPLLNDRLSPGGEGIMSLERLAGRLQKKVRIFVLLSYFPLPAGFTTPLL